MTSLSGDEDEIVKRHALGKSLDHLLEPLQDAERAYSISSSYADTPEQGYQKAVSLLLSALIDAEAALVLQSRTGRQLSYDDYRPLVKLVIQRNPKASDHHVWNAVLHLIRAHSRATTPIASLEQTLRLQNTSSFANSSEYRTHVDAALKEELGDLQSDVPGVFEAYFGNIAGLDVAARTLLGKIQKGESLLYNEGRSTAARKLDIGFVDGPDTTTPDAGGLRFSSRMDREQLGFDPTIVTHGTKRCIEIEKDGTTERLVIEGVIGRARCIAGRATTCWKVHREDEPNTPLVVKDSWQYPERDEEGELLREANEREVTNVARYYHHETVHVGGKPDDILGIRRSLPVPTSNQEKAGSKAASSRSRSRSRQTLQLPSSTTGRKPTFDHSNTSFHPPPSKRTKPSSPTKLLASNKPLNRVHRRVVVRGYGKPIFESSSRVSLLIGMQGCIEGYMSLYHKAGLIQSDISPRNLLVNEDENNPSYRAFLIGLDLAIRAERDESSRARGKTSTRAFMAIGVLYGEKHSFMHDLESFFWILFWICIHYEGPNKGTVVEQFEKWNYMDTNALLF